MNKQKILVLGADGFIGSNLVKTLLQKPNTEVIAFDLFRDGKAKNLDVKENLQLFAGNFLNRDDLERALKGIDYVFHFISLTTPGSSMNDPLIDVETNIKGTIVLLDECVKAGVKKVIFSSSGGSIYGNQDEKAFSETSQTKPISPYAISKLTIENYLEYYRIHRGLDYLVLRYSNPYGPKQNVVGVQGIIPIFLNLVKQDLPITIFGSGKNVRDYMYIDDMVAITEKMFDKKTRFNVYNIGSGKGTTINDVILEIKKATKKEVVVNYFPARDIDVKSVVLNTDKVENEFGNIVHISLEEGIQKTWDWVLKEKSC